MIFSGQLGTVRADQCDQFAGGDLKPVFARDADFPLIELDQQHAPAVFAGAQAQRAAQAPGFRFMLGEQIHPADCSPDYQLTHTIPEQAHR
jgi:hypothetical protein